MTTQRRDAVVDWLLAGDPAIRWRVLRGRQGPDGRWQLEWQPRGWVWCEMEPVGTPSRWVTLHALRILRWWDSWSEGAA